MAWFKCHEWLVHHPSIRRLGRLLEISEAHALGHVITLTAGVMEYVENGDLSGYDAIEIAHAAQWTGKPAVFLRALRKSQLLNAEGKLFFWDACVSNIFSSRGLNRERQRRHRAKQTEALHNASSHALHNASGNDDITPSSHAEITAQTRLDKTRQTRETRQDGTKGNKQSERCVCDGEEAPAKAGTHTHATKLSPDSTKRPESLPTLDQWQAAGLAAGMPPAWVEEEWQNQERKKMRDRWKGLATDADSLKTHAKFVLGLKRQRGQGTPAAPEVASKTL